MAGRSCTYTTVLICWKNVTPIEKISGKNVEKGIFFLLYREIDSDVRDFRMMAHSFEVDMTSNLCSLKSKILPQILF